MQIALLLFKLCQNNSRPKISGFIICHLLQKSVLSPAQFAHQKACNLEHISIVKWQAYFYIASYTSYVHQNEQKKLQALTFHLIRRL